ncbi:MAG: ABC transporter permease, partial [Alphaproteobacteria bacterium]|nr:ABC transporter permease [Alphaproteobacteria bacterium]
MRKLFLYAGLMTALFVGTAQAQVSDDVIKIGVLNDQSGSFADLSGPNGVIAAEMAVEDFGGTVAGAPIELV